MVWNRRKGPRVLALKQVRVSSMRDGVKGGDGLGGGAHVGDEDIEVGDACCVDFCEGCGGVGGRRKLDDYEEEGGVGSCGKVNVMAAVNSIGREATVLRDFLRHIV